LGEIIGAPEARPTRHDFDRARSWRLVAAIGVLFFVAGVVDVGLGVAPINFGNAALRFNAAVGLTRGWPILALGTVALLVGAAGAKSAVMVRAAVVLHGVLALVLVVILLVMMVDRSVFSSAGPMDRAVVNKDLVRGLTSALAFLVVHLLSVRAGLGAVLR
jgi:hypothetical protein